MCPGRRRELDISGGERLGAGGQSSVKDTAVGHPQASVSTQPRERTRGTPLERQLGDLQLSERGELLLEAAGAHSTNEHLRQGDGARGQLLSLSENRGRDRAVWVGVIEVGEQHARIEHRQVGHSSRSRSR